MRMDVPIISVGGVAEDPLGGGVPGRDDAVEVLADDRIVGRLDDRRQAARFAIGPVVLAEVLDDGRECRPTASPSGPGTGPSLSSTRTCVLLARRRTVSTSPNDLAVEDPPPQLRFFVLQRRRDNEARSAGRSLPRPTSRTSARRPDSTRYPVGDVRVDEGVIGEECRDPREIELIRIRHPRDFIKARALAVRSVPTGRSGALAFARHLRPASGGPGASQRRPQTRLAPRAPASRLRRRLDARLRPPAG